VSYIYCPAYEKWLTLFTSEIIYVCLVSVVTVSARLSNEPFP